jgi:alkylation response protein AidB-like acyl-CoA dehydrogenase
MEFNWPPEVEKFRTSVQEFLDANLPPGFTGLGALSGDDYHRFLKDWRGKLADAGLLALDWPQEYGGAGLTLGEQVVLAEEFALAGAPTGTPADGFGIGMLGNLLLRYGTEDQRRTLLPRILSGEDVWCQGFSEPDAGSDLANLRCQAVLDGDQWVVNGHKIWTSMAHISNQIFLLARTGEGDRPHEGISFLLLPLDQPGVEIRGIKMLSGPSEFNEVYFTDATTSASNVVGPVNGGWKVAMSILGYERGGSAAFYWLHFRAELERLIATARRQNKTEDPLVRQQLARCYTDVQVMRLLGLRSLTRYLAGDEPGALAALTKIQWTEYHQRVTELALDILGPAGLVLAGRWPVRFAQGDDPGASGDPSSWIASFLNARAGSIYGGTNQIQRNIVAEQVLGLPRQPRPSPSGTTT